VSAGIGDEYLANRLKKDAAKKPAPLFGHSEHPSVMMRWIGWIS
jgi:hypothetical protein